MAPDETQKVRPKPINWRVGEWFNIWRIAQSPVTVYFYRNIMYVLYESSVFWKLTEIQIYRLSFFYSLWKSPRIHRIFARTSYHSSFHNKSSRL